MYHVYILRSIKYPEQIYTGFTERKPEERLKDHNLGYSKHTSKFMPWKIIWHCTFEDKKKTLDFERYLKSGSGKAFRNKRLV